MNATAKQTIFILSGNTVVVQRLKSRLEPLKYDCHAFAHPKQVQVAMEKSPSGCVIIDDTTNTYSGFDMIPMLQANPDLYSLLIINPDDEHLALEMMTLGVTDYIVRDRKNVHLDLIPVKITRMYECRRGTSAESSLSAGNDSKTDQLRVVLDALPGFVSWISSDGKYLGVNKNLADYLGESQDYFVGKSIGFKNDKQPFITFVYEFFASGKEMETREIDVGPEYDMRQYFMVARKYNDNRAAVFVGLDISEQKKAEFAVRESARKINQLHEVAESLSRAENAAEVYRMTVDAAEEILHYRYAHMTIVDDDELVTVATAGYVDDGLGERFPADEGLAGRTFTNRETVVFDSISEVPEARHSDHNYQSGISAPIGDIGVFQVFSEQHGRFSWIDAKLLELLLRHTTVAIKQLEFRTSLKDLAILDPLTNLHNRNYLRFILDDEIAKAKKNRYSIAIVVVDITRLGQINATFNRQTGDQVLRVVAAIIDDESRETDIAVRYGNDEFLILLPNFSEPPLTFTKQIENTLAAFNSKNTGLGFTIQIETGYAVWDSKGNRSFEECLTEAEIKLAEAKKSS